MCHASTSRKEDEWSLQRIGAVLFFSTSCLAFVVFCFEHIMILQSLVSDLILPDDFDWIPRVSEKITSHLRLYWQLIKPFSAPSSEWCGLIYIQAAVLLIPAALAMIILTFGCHGFSHPWSNGKISKRMFSSVEKIMKFVRGMSYIQCLVYLALAYLSDNFQNSLSCMMAATICCILLFECNLQSLARLNFRRWPNYIISLSNALLYLALLDLFCSRNGDVHTPLLGFLPLFESVSRIDVINSFLSIPDTFRNSVIIAAVLAILKDSLSGVVIGGIDTRPTDLIQRRRRNRRRLLTHWHYNKDGILSSWENSIFILLVFEGCAFLFALAAILFLPTTVQATTGAELTKSLPFSSYIIMAAAIMCVPALLSFGSISDERLIQSEYLYLSYQGPRITPRDISNSTPRWRDFCQVLVNLYSNVSGLESEDRGYHSIERMLIKLRHGINTSKQCAKTKFFSDILSAKGDINATLRRESNHNTKGAPPKSDTVQQAQDVQFASALLALADEHLDSYKDVHGLGIAELNPLYLIEQLAYIFFDKQEHVWGQRLGAFNIDAEEGILLLKMDSMLYILQRESYGHCGLYWLGCNCFPKPPKCIERVKLTRNEQICRRLELLLVYPFIVIDCYKKRWNVKDNIHLSRDLSQYYWRLFDQKYLIDMGNLVTLERAIFNALQYFTASACDTSILRMVASEFRGEKIARCKPGYDKLSEAEKKDQQNRLYLANYHRKQSFERQDAPFLYFLRFSDFSIDSAEDMYRIAFSLFLDTRKGGNPHEP